MLIDKINNQYNFEIRYNFSLFRIEKTVKLIFEEIKESEVIEEVLCLFDELDCLQIQSCLMAFAEKVEYNDFIENFIRLFDNVQGLEYQKTLYNKIQSGFFDNL
jgi:hypothetical protein